MALSGPHEQIPVRRVVVKSTFDPHREILSHAQELHDHGFKVTFASGASKLKRQSQMVTPSGDDEVKSLKARVCMMCRAIDCMPGISCPSTDGALYAFPQIALPTRAVAAAQREGMDPDVFYCLELVRQAHVVCIPGFSSAQEDGTWHFRTVLDPDEESFDEFLGPFKAFHTNFIQKYQDVDMLDAEYLMHENRYPLTIAPVASKL